MAVAFVPVAIFGAGLSFKNSVVFAVGLLAGNVPEGLLPVITLALAVAVRAARAPRSAGQAPERRRDAGLHRCDLHRQDRDPDREPHEPDRSVDARRARRPRCRRQPAAHRDGALGALAEAAAACNNARLETRRTQHRRPDRGGAAAWPHRRLASMFDAATRERSRRHQYNFDPQRKLMSTLDAGDDQDWLHTKGAPESVLPRCTSVLANGNSVVSHHDRERVTAAGRGLCTARAARAGAGAQACPRAPSPPSASRRRAICAFSG